MINLRSKARQRLLAYYFANPTARLHLRALAERLSIDPSNLSKELGRLEREGLFRSDISGRQKYFQLDRKYPLFAEVRSIVSKTIGAPSSERGDKSMPVSQRKKPASKFRLRLMPSVRRAAEDFSQKEGVSLNQFINITLAEKLAHLQH